MSLNRLSQNVGQLHISLFANNTTNVIVDINGYFAPPAAGGLNFFTSSPYRFVDTRNANGPLGGPIMNGNTTRTFPLPTSICDLPVTAAAYSLNVTVVPFGSLGFRRHGRPDNPSPTPRH